MLDRLSLAVLCSAALVLVVVVELVRRRRLDEGYSLLWLAAGLLLIIMPLSRSLLDQIAELFGVAYPPSALFLVGFMAITGILLYFSTVISSLTRQNREAAQRLGLLQWQLQELEKRLAEKGEVNLQPPVTNS